MLLRAVPARVDRDGFLERLRLTAVSAALAAAGIPALALALVMTGAFPSLLSLTGFLMLWLVVPVAAYLMRAHRAVTTRLLGEPVVAQYADADWRNPVTAIATLRLSARPRCSMRTHSSTAASSGRPPGSLPATSATRPVQSAAVWG